MHYFIGNFDLSASSYVIVDTEIIHQIEKVLRLKVGEHIVLGDGKGGEAIAKIEQFSKQGVHVVIEKFTSFDNKAKVVIRLYCSIIKKDRFEWMLEKAVELGVSEVVPLICERTIKKQINYNRLNKIIKEAAEQSGRNSLPVLLPEVSCVEMLQSISSVERFILFDPSGNTDFLKQNGQNNECKINICIGPEGGWTEKELDMAKKNNVEIGTLGKTILRSETA
jgi:16S rRNA (uracil1498-N3)-methyltransferase